MANNSEQKAPAKRGPGWPRKRAKNGAVEKARALYMKRRADHTERQAKAAAARASEIEEARLQLSLARSLIERKLRSSRLSSNLIEDLDAGTERFFNGGLGNGKARRRSSAQSLNSM